MCTELRLCSIFCAFHESKKSTMSCVVCIEGDDFDVDAALPRLALESPLLRYLAVRRGEAHRRGNQVLVAAESSLNFEISPAFFAHLSSELPLIRQFLRAQAATLSWLSNAPGVQRAYVKVVMQLRDVAKFPQEDEALPDDIIRLLAMSGLRLRVSFSSE